MEYTAEYMKDWCRSHTNLVSIKKQAPGINVLKYKPKVFYKSLWCPELTECRGTVVDDDFNIIQRPFTKIYNYGEQGTKIDLNEKVNAVVKVNGFMCATTLHEGKLFTSTTGSTTSEFVDRANQYVSQYEKMLSPEYTYLFEICADDDKHIIEETEGAHLIGMRAKMWVSKNNDVTQNHLDSISRRWGCLRPNWQTYDTFQEVLDLVKTVKHEGFVIEGMTSGTELKLKSPYYLATKFLGRKSDKRFMEIMNNPRLLKRVIDEEFYSIIEYLNGQETYFLSLSEQERFTMIRDYFDKNVL